MLQKIHARLGDFWWYSLMLFVACRTGDAIQAFIGLWLVPKCVGASELGAVMPLQSLAGLLTTPLAVIAVVFSKYVNVYATRGEYGKVRSFIRDVFAATAVLFVLCLGGAYLVMPFFYERLRVASGSLTLLILLCGLMGSVSAIVTSAQQGLKRFKTMSVMNILGAPIRLVTMLVAMPFRALSGYILGQTTPPATTSLLSIVDIHRVLKGHAPDATWRRDLPAIWRYLWPYAFCTILITLAGAMTATIYRQRLPVAESAAYYMLTRLSEIAAFVSLTVGAILFPMASEAHEKGKEDRSLLSKSVLATLGGGIALALAFGLVARPIFSLTDVWRAYLPYAPLLPILTLTSGVGLSALAIANYELACGRIATMALYAVLNLAWAGALVAFTGADFFIGILPNAVIRAMHAAHFEDLGNLLAYTFVFQIVMLASVQLFASHTRRSSFWSAAPLSSDCSART